jgi:hypothetical protein
MNFFKGGKTTMNSPTKEQLLAAYTSLEKIIGETTVADGIVTPEKENGWRCVIDELVQLSIEDARKMGEGFFVDKRAYTLRYEQWVHARFMAMILELSGWMGKQWESHGLGTKQDFLRLVERAYDQGQEN